MFGEVMKNKDICKGVLERLTVKAVEDALNFLKKTELSPDVIAECCSLPLDEVNRLAMEMKKEAVQL